MDNSVTIILEKEYADELITVIKRVLSHNDDNDFLCTDDYNALDELRDTLIFKVGGH